MSYLLAGDVGGTKTVLAIYSIDHKKPDEQSLTENFRKTYSSSSYQTFSELLLQFLSEVQLDVSQEKPNIVCLGIAGPIENQCCNATNLPWVIDAQQLSQELQLTKVILLNDLEAAAYGMLCLNAQDFVELNPNAKPQNGHIAIIAAGTGLGEALLIANGNDTHGHDYGHRHYMALPTEGGHCDFAPNNLQEDALLSFLRERFDGHVSYERILAGDGFGNLYDFLRANNFADANPGFEDSLSNGDRNATISKFGLTGEDALCTEALRMFVRIYGSQAGNIALKSLPRGGLYIGGGIAPKIQSALKTGEFMQAFLDKGRMAHAIQNIPVRLVLNVDAPLLGAVETARQYLID